MTMWCVCGWSWRDDVCCVCECYRWDIMVMDVIWRRLCVNIIRGRVINFFWVGWIWVELVGLVEFVRCVCVWLGAAWVERGVSGWEDWVWDLAMLDACLCFGCGGVGEEWVGGMVQGLDGWCYVGVNCESGLSV